MTIAVTELALPPLSPPNTYISDILPRRKHDINDLAHEVRRSFEASTDLRSLLSLSAKLHGQIEQKLRAPGLCMLPSWNYKLPTGLETGTILALDVGGSTCRAAIVHLHGRSAVDGVSAHILLARTHCIDAQVRKMQGPAFFAWLADRVAGLLAEPALLGCSSAQQPLPIGLSWSFPIQQTSEHTFTLLDMGKDFCACQGLVGHDLGSLVVQACQAKNLNVRMAAVINDASATLLSRAYAQPDTCLSLIVGTGVNAAIQLPVSAFAPQKFGARPDRWFSAAEQVLVNTEVSLLGKDILPSTRWDDVLYKSHKQPDFQPLELRAGGRYIAELVRIICVDAIRHYNLFQGFTPAKLSVPYALEAALLAKLEGDESPGLSHAISTFRAAHPLPIAPSHEDISFVRSTARHVSRRATAILAAVVHALCTVRAQRSTAQLSQSVAVACNGSIIERYPGFQEQLRTTLENLASCRDRSSTASINQDRDRHRHRDKDGAASVQLAFDPSATLIGAAVAACCADS